MIYGRTKKNTWLLTELYFKSRDMEQQFSAEGKDVCFIN